MSFVLLFLFITPSTVVLSLSNGLARTPPMGWVSWQRFRCETDCETYPNDCINADLYQTMAERLANDGWLELGYNHVNIDDCWSTKTRNSSTNEQVPDPNRFPNGIKGVADYIHSLGVKFGLYSDIGTYTCGGYTGIDGNFELDANTFASWNIDMIKIDGCNESPAQMYLNYPLFGKALNNTGRPIVYSCSWPAYISGHGETVPSVDNTTLLDIAKYCNLWRNYDDIQDSWESVQSISKYWRRDYNNYSRIPFLNVAGPGQWNDPDMIIGGDDGLSISELETQFALWAIFAAPLLMSNDLRTISNEAKTVLQNKEIIDVNQDVLGKQGGYLWINSDSTPTEIIWMRELNNDSLAVVLQNSYDAGFGTLITFQSSLVPAFVDDGGWNNGTSFSVRNLLNHTDLGIFDGGFSDIIEPSSVGMYKLTMVNNNEKQFN